MSFEETIPIAAAAACAAAALGAALRRDGGPSLWSLVVGLGLLGTESILGALILSETLPDNIVRWHWLRLMTMGATGGVWLVFSACYARARGGEPLGRWVTAALIAGGVTLFLEGFWGRPPVAVLSPGGPAGQPVWRSGWPGMVTSLICVLSALAILMNIERTFRSAVGTMRWRIKYIVLGVALVFGVRVFILSQALLYSGVTSALLLIDASAVLIGSLLIGYSVLRARLSEAEIYPSRTVLHKSLAAVLCGIYLTILGISAKVLSSVGEDHFVSSLAFIILLGVVGSSVILLSDRVRQRLRVFVSRHFSRPLHDYQQVWSAFAKRTGHVTGRADYCRAVVQLISESLEMLSVTIWVTDERDKRLALGASTILSHDMAEESAAAWSGAHGLEQELAAHPEPFDVDEYRGSGAAALRPLAQCQFGQIARRVCAPLISEGELVGLLIVGDRVRGLPLTAEDYDLLKCMGSHVAASLRSIRLSERLLQAREMEAFQTMSAFLVHDLKNTVSLLSLMLQNMAAHFGDPAFREDAMRALSKSVAHLKDLVGRLTTLRQGLELKPATVDVNEIVTSALASLSSASGLVIERKLAAVPRIQADPDQLGKVFANLLMNACEAIAQAGRITVETRQDNAWVEVWVRDNGCGMSPDFVRHQLFRPFQTTKKQGLGIGMFQSRMIVEAHRGRMTVDSEPGQGTAIRVLLPMATPNA